MSFKNPIIFIAAGGTGGHIYPALSVAHQLKKNVEVHFVGSNYGLETSIIPKNNYILHTLPVRGLANTTFVNKIVFLFSVPFIIGKSMYLLLKYRPKFVFGFGGYASGPIMLMAWLLCKKTALFESNAKPGVTNRILAKFVKKCFVTFSAASSDLNSKNISEIGFPVRSDMIVVHRKPSSNFRVLIFGGSQGAHGINVAVSESLKIMKSWPTDIEFVHQTGKRDFDIVSAKYTDHSRIKCLEYLDPIRDYYAWADLVFCRAGASTLAELAACGKAAVLIPFPYASDDHQKKNAEALVSQNAAVLCVQPEFTPEKFKSLVLEFKNNPVKLVELETHIQMFYKPKADEKMAQFVLDNI